MGYQVTGAEGVVTSWTGTFYANLLSKMRAMNASVTAVGEVIDVSALGDYGRRTIPGLSSWTAQLEGYPLTNSGPEVGNVGNLVMATAANVFVDSFSLNISADVIDTTSFGGASLPWKTFRPGAVRWSGSLTARMDSTAQFPFPAVPGASPVSTTFTYGTTSTLTGTIQITNINPAIRVGSVTLFPISFEGVGAITAAGAGDIFGAAVLGSVGGAGSMAASLPEWNSSGASAKPLVITLSRDGTQVLTGADSFWSSLGLSCGVGSATKLTVGVQGSGSLTCT